MNPRLPTRLFVSYALVILVGAAAAYVTVRLLVPPLFDHRMGMDGTSGMGSMRGQGNGTAVHDALISALNAALLVAVGVSVVVGGLVAAFVARRLLAPLEAVRGATRRIAAGDYSGRVPVPGEPELAALAADVNTLALQLAETETRRTRLLGDVAHEMRTPLTALDGYVEGLLDGVFSPEPEHWQAMSEDLRRLHRLADDLSALSRAEEGRIELQPLRLDLVRLAGDAANRLRQQYDDAGVGLAVPAGEPVWVVADPDRITQVVTNLLGNALIASRSGDSVEIRVTAATSSVSLTVTDTGVGFSADDGERLFERFYRAPTAYRRAPGSGVGLTIARSLARASGGDLTAASAGPGQGATFTLRLPAAA